MVMSSLSSDPLERVLSIVYEDYRARLDAQALDEAIALARGQAVHLGMENRPQLVEAAVRSYLDSLTAARPPVRSAERA